MPVPVELLRFFDRAARPVTGAEPPAGEAQAGHSLPSVPAMPALTMPADLPVNAALTAPLNAVPKEPVAR
jgi:hypothetical protein